jgi:protein-tyrosine phosphatase
MAEAVFRKMVDDAGMSDRFEVDSAGTGSWHIGEPAHAGTRRVLAQNGINYAGRARQVRHDEITQNGTYVIAMDADNMSVLRERFGDIPHLYRLLDFAGDASERNVPDPYFEGNFDRVYELVEDGCRGLLAALIEQERLEL